MYNTITIKMDVTGFFNIRRKRKECLAAVNYARNSSVTAVAEFSEKRKGFLFKEFTVEFQYLPVHIRDRIKNWFYNVEESFKTIEERTE